MSFICFIQVFWLVAFTLQKESNLSDVEPFA